MHGRWAACTLVTRSVLALGVEGMVGSSCGIEVCILLRATERMALSDRRIAEKFLHKPSLCDP